jgi:hypothetical protein
LAYAKVFKKEGLVELVRQYRRYNREMCREKLMGGSLFNQGISLYQKGRWEEALDKWTESLKICKKIGDWAGEAQSLNSIGNFYSSLSQYAEAMRYYQDSLEISRKIGDGAGKSRSLANIGNVYYSLGQYPEALKYYHWSLEMSRTMGNVAGEAKTLGNIGLVYNVYKTDFKNARYILFSTHGLLGGDFSGVAEPALALTLIDNPPGTDGFLTMSEVLGLDLNSELIILSACNTSGRGDKTGSGEGFVGLTRSFMYAGGKSLLVTHWSVESEAARDLMVGTFKNVNKEARPEALRKAKLTMKNSTRQKGN